MCDEWLYDYMVFRKWALANGFIENSGRNDCTVERKDYNGNYEPSNCKIIPMREQLYNKRNNHKLEYNGETHCVSEWIEILGLNRDIVWYRVKKKLPVEEILYKGRLSDKRKNEIQGGMYG
jgi:hypothetical protein